MQSKKISIIIFALFFAISISGSVFAQLIIPQGFSFQTSLKLGDTTIPDVSYLQNFLNQNPVTRVADTGPGSDGELTNYFGPKTFDAVIRFQNLYSSEVLIPAGITVPSGFFGMYSRNKANNLLQTMYQSNTVPQTTINPSQPATPITVIAKVPTITSVFSENSFSQGTTTLDRPRISGLYPNLVYSAQDEINIYGYNFTDIGNVVYGSLGSIENLKSSNNTITFRLADFSEFNTASKYYSGTTTQIYIKVSNLQGVSEELASVRFTFPYIGDYSGQYGGASTGGTANDKSNSSNMNALGMVDVGSIDKEIHGFSPDGALIKLIGGDETFDTLYGYSPSGVIFGGGPTGAGGVGGIGGGGANGGGQSSGLSDVDNGGGQITNVTYCTCSGGQLLEVTDVRGGTRNVFFRYGQSKLNEEYNIYAPGPNYVNGLTKESVQCEVYDGESCDTQGTADWVIDTPRGIGTSLE